MPDPLFMVEDHSNTVSLVSALADYAANRAIESESAIATARLCLLDALACGFESLRDPERAALIGPLVPGALMPGGARVPGTSLELDPAQAAFCTALMLCRRWRGSHSEVAPEGCAADPIGGILAVADYLGRKAAMEGKPPPKVRGVLGALVKALEIQSVLAPASLGAQTRPGAVSIRAARAAATAIVTTQLGGALGQIATALSYACMDGAWPIEAAEEYDPRRGDWARADAIGRAVRHACQAMAAGRPSYLTADDLAAVDRAGKLLGAGPWTPRKAFGTEAIGRLAGLRQPQQAAQIAMRFQAAIERYFPPRQAERIKALFAAPERLDDLPVNELLAALVTNGSTR